MDAVLVGVVVPGVENHSLAVLGQALADAGLSHRIVPFLGFAGMRETVDEVVRARPRVCGISLQTTEAALATVSFAALLRRAGYDGTIAVGGHLATLAPDTILASGVVDVVVRLAGERALVGLARGEDPRTLPGTVTRAGEGLPPLPVGVRAMRRTRLSEHLGFGAADLIVSRGCPAHCGYCCVATVSDVDEQATGARHLVRDVERIADEIADAASLGGRAFHFMDDNILPLDPDAALAWCEQLRMALARRRVPRIAFSLQLRADVMTRALAGALVELGLVRAYIGIDGYTAGQLRAIGRNAPAQAGARAIELLSTRGVFCVANALVIGPTIGFDTLVGEIDGLAAIEHAPVHLLPIEARPGTVYHKRASARGLIEGGPLWPAYRFEDERTFLVGEVITRLPTRLLERSVPIAMYDLAWALGVAARLAPELDISEGRATYQRVAAAWNADQVRILRAAAAASVDGRDAIEALLATEAPIVRAFDEQLIRACDAALAEVERALSRLHAKPVKAHARGRLLGALAFGMGLAAACHDPGPRHDIDAAVDAPPVIPDALPNCEDMARTSKYWNTQETCDCFQAMDKDVQVTFNDRGEVTAITMADGSPLPGDIEQCVIGMVASYCYPTNAGTTVTMPTCHVWIA